MHAIWYHPHSWVLCIGIGEEIFVWKMVTEEHWIWMLNCWLLAYIRTDTKRSIYPMAMISNRNRNKCAKYMDNRMCYKSKDLLCAAPFNPLLNSTFLIRQLINFSQRPIHNITNICILAQNCQLQTILPLTLSLQCKISNVFWMLECLDLLSFEFSILLHHCGEIKNNNNIIINGNKYYPKMKWKKRKNEKVRKIYGKHVFIQCAYIKTHTYTTNQIQL